MHYYQFNIADYRKDTQHLTPIEHYIYRELIDWYYLDEKPIPKENQKVLRRLRLVSENNQELANVLNDFFIEDEKGWYHGRIDEEITKYHTKIETLKANGSKGGRPKKANKNQKVSKRKANVKATNNHKPITNNQYIKEIYKEKSFSNDEITLFDEYISLREKLKLSNSETVIDRLIKKYCAYGRESEIIAKAINSSWKDFYPLTDSKSQHPQGSEELWT